MSEMPARVVTEGGAPRPLNNRFLALRLQTRPTVWHFTLEVFNGFDQLLKKQHHREVKSLLDRWRRPRTGTGDAI